MNAAASQAVRPVQQQQIRLQQQVQEITAFIASHTDPVLKDRLEDLNTAAVPVMTKRGDAHVWKDRYMAVRRGAILYGCSSKDVLRLADSLELQAAEQHRVIKLSGCSVAKYHEQTDKEHYAFVLTISEVRVLCFVPLQLYVAAALCHGGCCVGWLRMTVQIRAVYLPVTLLRRGSSCFCLPAMQRCDWPYWRP